LQYAYFFFPVKKRFRTDRYSLKTNQLPLPCARSRQDGRNIAVFFADRYVIEDLLDADENPHGCPICSSVRIFSASSIEDSRQTGLLNSHDEIVEQDLSPVHDSIFKVLVPFVFLNLIILV
jgi:hypothetical protein